jgi:hypothetical protein
VIVTIENIGRAVISSDTYNQKTELGDVEHIIEIALKKLALCSPVHVDLENGHHLAIVMVKS